jgi:hypothetical protein
MSTSMTAYAQETSQDGAVLTFAPDYFSAYSPVTAYDMVSQVPGFSIDNGAQVRGLADTFANVLIDGERQSTKSESIGQILGRIPVASVERIEFIRESVAGVDMRGQSRVVNVVLRDGGEQQTTMDVSVVLWRGVSRWTPNGSISRNWDFGNTRLTLGADFDQNAAPALHSETLQDAAGGLIESRVERNSQNYIDRSVNGNLTTRFDDESRLNLVLTASDTAITNHFRSLVDDAAGNLSRVELYAAQGDYTSWEGTATYERPFTEQVSGQIVFLNRENTSLSNDIYTYAPAVGTLSRSLYNSDVDSGERALRGTVSWERSEQHSFEFGAETALNYRDNGLQIFDDTPGGLVAVDLPVANTRVEERRSEVFASHVWRPNADVTVESGFRFERSNIEQTGDAQRERSFSYPKPSVSLTWDASENTQWKFTVEREVEQLSFGAFASQASLTENTVEIGNPELVPSKIWRASASWERRWGDEGSVTVSLTHERYTDAWDLRPITIITDDTTTPVTTEVFETYGSIGDGEKTFLFVEGAIPLDGLGLADSRLNFNAMLRNTKVTDPTTGETRRFQGHEVWRLNMDFRQNLPEHDLAWGWSLYTQGYEDVFRYTQSDVYTHVDPSINIFIESTAIDGVTLSLRLGDVLAAVRERERTFYTGSRVDDIVAAREIQERNLGGYVVFGVQSTF